MTKALLKRLEEGKLYYSISEVCQITGLEQHVLRYWESEFPQLKPRKNRAGNRAYRSKEIKLIRYIKYLLYDEQYTVQGAKRKIAEASAQDLEGQVNLLGALPGVGAATPQAAISSEGATHRRSKAKSKGVEPVGLVEPVAPQEPAENANAHRSVAAAQQGDLTASSHAARHATTNTATSPVTQKILLDLRDELKSLLQILQVKT